MPTLKYLDPVSGTYKALPGIVGPPGPRADLGVVIEPPAYGSWYRNNNLTLTHNVSAQVPFDMEAQTPVGMSIDAAGYVTVQTAGLYTITAHLAWVANAAGNRYGWIYAGPGTGTNLGRTAVATNTAAGGYSGMTLAATRYLNAGDVIKILAYQSSGANLDLFGDTTNRSLTLEVAKIPAVYSGSAVSTYGERNYSAMRTLNSTQTIPHNTQTAVLWDTQIVSDGITYTAPVFTVPAAGYYDVCASVIWNSTGVTGYRQIRIMQNGSTNSAINMNAAGGNVCTEISRTILCAAGDTIQFNVFSTQGADTNLVAAGANNFVSITKIPTPVVNGAAASGVWGAAPLDSYLYGSNSLIGREIYVDSNGQLRAKPDVIEMGGGVDLNTMTRTGYWTQSQTVDAASGSNYPVGMAGLLEVVTNYATNMTWQRYTVYSSNGPQYGNIYSRGAYNGTWYPWREVLPVDSGWVNISIVSGFAAYTDPPRVRKIGSVVYVKGAFANTGMSTAGSYSAGIIPAGYTPVAPFYAAAGCSSGSITAQFVIGAGAGDSIQVRTGATLSTTYYLSGSWTID